MAAKMCLWTAVEAGKFLDLISSRCWIKKQDTAAIETDS